MAVLYQAVGVYWLVVYLSKVIEPQIDKDFLVIDQNLNSLPLYYVASKAKLYILLESPISDDRSLILGLYIQDNITNHVLISDKVEIEKGEDFNIYAYFNDQMKAKSPTKNIEDVLNAAPDQLPDQIRTKFLEKYHSNFMQSKKLTTLLPQNDKSTTLLPQNDSIFYNIIFPPLTNG
nr:hypothetical protein [Abalone asfa-like virus]